MFIVALSIIAEEWEKNQYSSTFEWIDLALRRELINVTIRMVTVD